MEPMSRIAEIDHQGQPENEDLVDEALLRDQPLMAEGEGGVNRRFWGWFMASHFRRATGLFKRLERLPESRNRTEAHSFQGHQVQSA
jgi:hypothetical protein